MNASCLPLPSHPVLPDASSDFILREGKVLQARMNSRLGAGSWGCLSKESLLRWGSLPGSRMKSVLGGRTFPWSGTNLFSITGLLLSLRKALKTKDLSLPRPARRPAPPR